MFPFIPPSPFHGYKFTIPLNKKKEINLERDNEIVQWNTLSPRLNFDGLSSQLRVYHMWSSEMIAKWHRNPWERKKRWRELSGYVMAHFHGWEKLSCAVFVWKYNLEQCNMAENLQRLLRTINNVIICSISSTKSLKSTIAYSVNSSVLPDELCL